MTALSVSVPGIPAPQGSLRHLGAGRTVHSNATTLLPWRASVIAHIRQAMAEAGEWPLNGPVAVEVKFHLPRPKSAPKSRLWPDRKPDLDKLARAAGDALEQSGAIVNDAQIVHWVQDKEYGQPGMDLVLQPVSEP